MPRIRDKLICIEKLIIRSIGRESCVISNDFADITRAVTSSYPRKCVILINLRSLYIINRLSLPFNYQSAGQLIKYVNCHIIIYLENGRIINTNFFISTREAKC